MQACIMLQRMQSKPIDRAAERLAWVRHALDKTDLALQPASSDASFRSYWRTVGITPGLLAMDAPPPQEDLRPWLDMRRRLAHAGVRVPDVRASDESRGLALIEDFGKRSCLDALDDTTVDALYGKALDTLLQMQSRADVTALPDYDTTRLRDELDLLRPWFLERHLGLALSPASVDVLDDGFATLIASALEQPTCFVHRDYHSRNLMLTADGGLGVIDFQDAVRGPVTYDLVSLLRDCYVEWDESQVDRWREAYRQRLVDARLLPADTRAERFERWFDLMGVQRHLKVLGIFCRLYIRDGKSNYLSDLPRVLRYVLRVAARYPELAGLVRLLHDATHGRDIDAPSPLDGGRSACTR